LVEEKNSENRKSGQKEARAGTIVFVRKGKGSAKRTECLNGDSIALKDVGGEGFNSSGTEEKSCGSVTERNIQTKKKPAPKTA